MSKQLKAEARGALQRGDMLPKAERRAAGKRAAAERVAAARRRQMIKNGAAAVGVVGLVFVVFAACGGLGTAKKSDSTATGSTASSASPTAPASFPPVPADSDPALLTKPVAKAGTGALPKLVVTTLVEGKGAPIQNGQSVTVNYVGVSYATGKEFDSSWTRQQPFTLTLGAGGVIKGWDQGLVGVKVGSRVQLDIPAALAYGDPAPAGSPAGALRFIVDVLSAS